MNLMLLYRIILFAFLLVYCSLSYSQNGASIHFESPGHNFGKENEENGELQHDFLFTNSGVDPLIVTDVSASGGVLVKGWTKIPVMPGDSGIVSVGYDPTNKPGKFNRSITVSSTGNPPSVILRLLGDIIPREKSTRELYPIEMGLLRLKSDHIIFGTIFPGSVHTSAMPVINLSRETLDISFTQVPGHISVKAMPERLGPGDNGLIIASHDAGRINGWGMTTGNLRILLNGSAPGRNILYLSANIREDFSGQSDEERERAPVISFENPVFEFNTLRHGETIEHQFDFTNTGKSQLIIRAVRSGCGCTSAQPMKSMLQPGETGSIKAVFNSSGFQGRQNTVINVISNDPANPDIVLRITGEVTSE
jgi:hypothetical protein